jgi:ribose/xylose/arabinose/galactoside ABC-type transport system permease subunit
VTTTTHAIAAAQDARLSANKRLILLVSRFWAWVFLLLMIIFFAVTVPMFSGGATFFTVRNSQNILNAIVPVLLLGLGQTFVIISAGIDLSVGWVMSLGSVLSAHAIRWTFNNGVPLPLAVILGFLAAVGGAAIVGLVNGTIIAKLKVPAFIVTLGSSFIVRGTSLLFSENTTVIGLPEGIRGYGNESLLYHIRGDGGGFYILEPPADLTTAMVRQMDRILAWPVVITAVVVALCIFLLMRTQFGRHTYAIGGNMQAALRTGIPVDRHIIKLYMLSSVTAGIAGFLSTLRFTSGSAVIGDPLLLSSIAAVIIGGVSLFGGAGSIVGTIIGALIIAVLTTGLVMLGVPAFIQFIVVGIVVILAVLIDQSRDLIIGKGRRGG